MIDAVRFGLDLWVAVMMVTAFIFIVREFDVTRRTEWIGGALTVPALAGAEFLALADAARIFATLSGWH